MSLNIANEQAIGLYWFEVDTGDGFPLLQIALAELDEHDLRWITHRMKRVHGLRDASFCDDIVTLQPHISADDFAALSNYKRKLFFRNLRLQLVESIRFHCADRIRQFHRVPRTKRVHVDRYAHKRPIAVPVPALA